jgi:hypothetical protein
MRNQSANLWHSLRYVFELNESWFIRRESFVHVPLKLRRGVVGAKCCRAHGKYDGQASQDFDTLMTGSQWDNVHCKDSANSPICGTHLLAEMSLHLHALLNIAFWKGVQPVY